MIQSGIQAVAGCIVILAACLIVLIGAFLFTVSCLFLAGYTYLRSLLPEPPSRSKP